MEEKKNGPGRPKTSNRELLVIRVDSDFKEELKKKAKSNDRNLTGEVIHALKLYISGKHSTIN